MPKPATSTELEAAAASAEAALTDDTNKAIDDTVAAATNTTDTTSESNDEAYPWPMGKKLNIVAHNVSGQNLFLTHQAANGQQYTLFHGAKRNGKGNCAIMFKANNDQNALLPVPADFE
jgi:hypothetical protein